MNKIKESGFLLFAIAKEWERESNFIESEKYYRRLTKAFPDYVGVYYHFATLLLHLGRAEEASQYIEIGIKYCLQSGDHHAANELRSL